MKAALNRAAHNCEYCHQQFYGNRESVRKFCCKEHFHLWRAGRPKAEFESCYHKEARAILEGKHWQGKNRCVKLPGDEAE